MSRYFFHACSITLITLIFFSTACAQLNVAIQMDPNPSPYLSDWRSNPNTILVIVTNPTGEEIAVRFDAYIEGDTRGRVAETILDANIPPVFIPPGTSAINGVDAHLLEEGAVRYIGPSKEETRKSGKLPDDNFTLCVTLVQYENPSEILSPVACTRFSIRLLTPPYLIAPRDKGNVLALPTFQWSVAPLGTRSFATYEFRLVEVQPGQTNYGKILETNIPLVLRTTSLPLYQYLASDPTLEVGHVYVWQVKAYDPQGRYTFANNGKSQFWSFTYGPEIKLIAPSYVNDGISADIDYSKLTTTLSGNWSSVPGAFSYDYAIGTTQGGTEVLAWQSAGSATSFTRSGLALHHGWKYYISVKARNYTGASGPVGTSDGVTIDTSRPSSTITIPVPSGKSSSLYLNNHKVNLTWKGYDDVSPVTAFDIYYKRKEDLLWSKWQTNTSTTAGVFPADLKGGDGVYYFRAQAKDAAGNEELFEDKAEAETTIDTKPPTSSVSALKSNQNSVDFLVKWTGKDELSGIDYYDIQVKVDNGSWKDWTTKNTGTSQQFSGKAGHTYAFRSRATDKAGNVEAYPTAPDANTNLPSSLKNGPQLLATTIVDSIVVYGYGKSWSSAQVNLQFTGPSNLFLKVNETQFSWFDEGKKQYANNKEIILPPLLFNIGDKKSEMVNPSNKSAFNSYIAKSNKSRLVHYIDVVYKGMYTEKGKEKPSYSIQSNPVRLKIIYYKSSPGQISPPSLEVSVEPSTISYAPDRLSNSVDIKLHLWGDLGQYVVLDKVTNYWYRADGTPLKTLSSPLQPMDTIYQAETKWRRNITMSITKASLLQALNGKQQAKYMVKMEYSGKDQDGATVKGSTLLPLTVWYYASTSQYQNFLVSASTENIDYYPGLTKQQIEFHFSWQAYNTITVDSYSETLINPDGSKTALSKENLPPFTLKPGPGTFPVTQGGKTIYVPIIQVKKAFNLPIKLDNALKGKTSSKYKLQLTFFGKDNTGKVFSSTSYPPIKINIYSKPPVQISANVTPNAQVFDGDHLQRTWNASLSYSGVVWALLDSLNVLWYDEGGTFIRRNSAQDQMAKISFQPSSGSAQQTIKQTISDYGRLQMLNRAGVSVATGQGYKSVTYKIALEYTGKDALGRRLTVTTNQVDVEVREKLYPLTVVPDPKAISSSDENVPVKYTISSTLNEAVTLISRTTRIKKGTELMPLPGYGPPTPGFKGTVTDEVIAYSSSMDIIPANGLFSETVTLHLNTKWLLGNDSTAQCVAEVTYKAKNAAGKIFEGRVYIPIDLSKPGQETDTLVTGTDLYFLIPKVAAVRTYPGLTTVSMQGSSKVLNGTVQLILIPSPFDSLKLAITANALTFAPPKGKSGVWKVQSGSFKEKATKIKKYLFKILKDFVQVQEISFDTKRQYKLLIDKATATIPILDKTIYFKNLIIDENGLNMKISEQEITAFGLTFRVTNIDYQSTNAGSLLSLTVGLRLAKKPKAEEFVVTKLTVQDVGGKKSVSMKASPSKPVRIIPNTDYLNFESFEFKDTGNDNWALEVSVSSTPLPFMKKMGPITGSFFFESTGKLGGKLALIKETTPGYANDVTSLTLGKYLAVDLTYLGVQLAWVKTVGMDDNGKPDTSYAFDNSQSFVGIAADFYLPFSSKTLSATGNRVAVGDYQNPGITIDFNGKVTAKSISISLNKKLDLGLVYIKLSTLGLNPYPFSLELSGGLGVNIASAVEGELTIQGLKIDSNGVFSNFAEAVGKGGSLTILKVVKAGISNIGYSDKSTTLDLQKSDGKTSKKTTINVDSYFKLEGAILSIGENGSVGSGGFQRLMVFSSQGSSSFILNQAKISIKNAVDLAMDFEYVNLPQQKTQYLAVGGKAKIVQKYEAVVYGKMGKEYGKTTVGIFIAANNLQIPIGPVMLDGLGGGFFYNPSAKDVNTVKTLAGFSEPKLNAKFASLKPASSGPGSFAIFLYAGIVISDKSLFQGRALMTITGNYWQLDAQLKAIKEMAEAYAQLTISWNPAYFEGKIQVGVDFILIKAEKEDNYFAVYAYSKKTWGISGKTNVSLFYFIKTSSELYIGSSGFLFDLAFEESIDIGVIEGGIRYETMVWWKVGVSWGAYASVKAWGEVLWGLVGAEIGLEGAFIGQPEYVVFAAGHLKVTVVWVISWEGRVWVAVGKVGFDGGTGSNSKYDDIIADARNTGKQMKSEMDKLAKDLEKARAAMYTLSDKQRAAAGQALITLSAGGDFGTALIGYFIRKLYDDDRNIGNKSNHPYLNKVFDLIWDKKAAQLEARRKQLEKDKQTLATALKSLDSETKNVQKRLQEKKNVLEGKLPTLASLGKYGNPVGSPQYKTVTVNGKTKTVKVGYAFDKNKAKKLTTGMKKEKQDYLKYRRQLLSLAKKFINNLKEVDNLLYGKSNSVSHLVSNFTSVYQQSSMYSTHLWDYFNARQYWAAKKEGTLIGWKSNIDDDLRRISFTDHWWKVLAFKRNLVVNTLKQAAGIKQLPKIDTSKQYANWDSVVVNLGREMWYEIPKAGFHVTAQNMSLARQQYLQTYQDNHNLLQAKWNLFTMTSDKVYNRKVKLYTLLYDLMDQLSLEAGTRKLQPAPSGNVIVQTVIAFNPTSAKSQQVSGLSSTGNAGKILKGNIAQGNFGQVSQTNKMKVQSQSMNPGQYKAAWAKEWDFEKTRKYIKKLLQVPKITQFTGTMRSNPNTIGYATLTLQWKASHPAGIAEYSFDIPGYSQPVKLSAISPPSPTPQKKSTPQKQTGQAKLAGQQKGLIGQQFGSPLLWKLISKKEIGLKATQIGTSVTYGRVKLPSGPSHAWRSVDNSTKLLVPFFYGVHKAGTYDIWIRARGAGGLSLERKATVNVDYAYAVTKEDSAKGRDIGSPTKQSSLNISDATSPTIPSVDDGGPYTSSSTLIYAKWSAVDYESGVQEYQYRVVNRSGKFTYQVLPWISAGGQTEMNIRLDTPMKPGTVYYVEVKARNGAGMWSAVGSSNGIQLKDATPPSKPTIMAVLLADTLEASWAASSDPESGILGYRYALGSASGKDDVIPWTAVSTTSIHLSSAHLKAVSKKPIVKGNTYYLSLRAVNGINVPSLTSTTAVVAK